MPRSMKPPSGRSLGENFRQVTEFKAVPGTSRAMSATELEAASEAIFWPTVTLQPPPQVRFRAPCPTRSLSAAGPVAASSKG